MRRSYIRIILFYMHIFIVYFIFECYLYPYSSHCFLSFFLFFFSLSLKLSVFLYLYLIYIVSLFVIGRLIPQSTTVKSVSINIFFDLFDIPIMSSSLLSNVCITIFVFLILFDQCIYIVQGMLTELFFLSSLTI